MAAEVRAAIADIPMGMTEVEDGGQKVLFIRDKNGLRAFEAACPHYGAPLAEGHICGRKLYCPWHKAAFDIGDGALVQPPARHGLKQYTIRTDGEKVVAILEPIPITRPSKKPDGRTFVLVGTGASAVSAVTTLRYEGFGGKIIMIGREDAPPYDRTALSKTFLAEKTDPSKTYLDEHFYKSHDVEYRLGPAARIEPANKSVTLHTGETIVGDALLVATGSAAVMPPFAGSDLRNIFTLRSLSDAVALSDTAASGKRIAVVGGGFIALEAAAFLTKRGLVATVISPEPLPLATRFGDDVAHAIKVYHESTGVQFRRGKVVRFEGDGAVSAVRLDGGDSIDTDLVLVAAGAKPESDSIEARKREDGGIDVGADLQLVPGVWLTGDIAAFPDPRSGETARIEHWRLAEQQGRHAALGVLGRVAPFVDAPFFWSNQGAKRLDYAGYASSWDKIVFRGDVAKLDFIAYYIRDGRALAACAIGQNDQMIAFLHLLDEGRLMTGDHIAESNLLELL